MVSRRFVEGYWWWTRSFFLEKRKNQRKIDFVFLPRVILSSGGLGDYYIGRYASVLFGRYRSKGQRRLLYTRSCPTALYIASWLLFSGLCVIPAYIAAKSHSVSTFLQPVSLQIKLIFGAFAFKNDWQLSRRVRYYISVSLRSSAG